MIPVSRLSFLQQYSAANKGVCVCNEITWLWPWSALIHNQRLAVIGKIAARITVISTGFNFMWESEGAPPDGWEVSGQVTSLGIIKNAKFAFDIRTYGEQG